MNCPLCGGGKLKRVGKFKNFDELLCQHCLRIFLTEEVTLKTRHHICPSSRGGSNCKENIAYITDKLHRKYHDLFSNKVPTEILDFLVEYFWKGNVEYIYQYLERRGK